MAAEIPGVPPRFALLNRGFNEAAANGRGNRRRYRVRVGARQRASMRPRRMAAEIDFSPVARLGDQPASMRPRRMAAEIEIIHEGMKRYDAELQ